MKFVFVQLERHIDKIEQIISARNDIIHIINIIFFTSSIFTTLIQFFIFWV